jgi:hypothetical protein
MFANLSSNIECFSNYFVHGLLLSFCSRHYYRNDFNYNGSISSLTLKSKIFYWSWFRETHLSYGFLLKNIIYAQIPNYHISVFWL